MVPKSAKLLFALALLSGTVFAEPGKFVRVRSDPNLNYEITLIPQWHGLSANVPQSSELRKFEREIVPKVQKNIALILDDLVANRQHTLIGREGIAISESYPYERFISRSEDLIEDILKTYEGDDERLLRAVLGIESIQGKREYLLGLDDLIFPATIKAKFLHADRVSVFSVDSRQKIMDYVETLNTRTLYFNDIVPITKKKRQELNLDCKNTDIARITFAVDTLISRMEKGDKAALVWGAGHQRGLLQVLSEREVNINIYTPSNMPKPSLCDDPSSSIVYCGK